MFMSKVQKSLNILAIILCMLPNTFGTLKIKSGIRIKNMCIHYIWVAFVFEHPVVCCQPKKGTPQNVRINKTS